MLRETIQRRIKDQRVENMYIDKRIDEMYSSIREILKISRTHKRTSIGNIYTIFVMEIILLNAITMDKCDIEVFESMFYTMILKIQLQGEKDEACML